MEQYLQEPGAENLSQDDISLTKWKSISPTVDEPENNPPGGLDCNICLDLVQDPVVTLCGHLYCWPCIYKWIHFQSVPSENTDPQPPQCPVCKAEVSQETLIPLYGRGLTSTKSSAGKAPQFGIVIPQRPSSPRCGAHLRTVATTTPGSHPLLQIHHRNHAQQPQPYHYPHPGSYLASPPTLNLGGTTTNVFQPTTGMFGDMVYARIFGNSDTTLYSYPNSYHIAGSISPRMRRHVMQADESLGRVSFFLCCCMILCLLLF